MFFKKQKKSSLQDQDDSELSEREEYDLHIEQVKHALFEGQRHHPDHCDIDRSELDGGIGWATCVDVNGWAIDYFQDLPDRLDEMMSPDTDYFIGPWVLERRRSPIDPRDYNNGPRIAVCFNLYYNAQELGLVMFRPSSWSSTPGDRLMRCIVAAEIRYAPLLPARHIFSLLGVISEDICLTENGEGSSERITSIHRSMLELLWEQQRLSRQDIQLNFYHSAFLYLKGSS